MIERFLPEKIKEIALNKIVSAVFGISVIVFLAKIFGYIEKLLLAYYFGTDYRVDAYTTVFTFITSIFVFVRELIEPGFLYVFTKMFQEDVKSAWGLFHIFFIFILLSTFCLSAFSFFFPDLICDLISPGFKDEKRQLTLQMIKLTVPASIFYSLSALTNITLNSFKKFIYPALGDLILKVGLVVGLLAFYKSEGIYATCIGIFLGCAARLAIHFLDLMKQIKFDTVKVRGEYYLEIWRLTWPLLMGVSFSQISYIVDNVLASYLQEGAISSLSYAKKVVELPIISIPYVISVVIFPYFTRYHIEGDQVKATDYLNNSIKLIVIVFIPLGIFFVMNSVPIIELIYQRGAFKRQSTILTARAFMIYSIAIVFLAIEAITVVYYFAKGNTRMPILVGMVCVIINLLVAYFLIPKFGYLSIAIGFVVSKIIKNLYLIFDLYRRGDLYIPFKTFYTITGSSFLAGFISLIGVSLIQSSLGTFITLFISVLLFAGVYIALIFRMKVTVI